MLNTKKSENVERSEDSQAVERMSQRLDRALHYNGTFLRAVALFVGNDVKRSGRVYFSEDK